MKKILLFIILVLLISCIDSGTQTNLPANETDPNSETTVAKPVTDKFDGLDFDGYEFKIVTRIMQASTMLLVDSINGEVVNDAIYERNLAVSEKLNVKFSETQYDANNLITKFRTSVTAGDNAFDFAAGRGMDMFTFAAEGFINPISALPYIDLSAPYWNKQITDELTIDGKIFFAVGELSLVTYDMTHILLLNKQVLKNHDLDDVYGIIKNGKWTFDVFNEMGKAVTYDYNGDGLMNVDDSYGFVSCYKQVIPSFSQSSLIKSVEKNNDGSLYFALPGNQKFIDVVGKIFESTYDIWYSSNLDVNNIGGPVLMDMFTSGRGLFMDCTFYHVAMFRDTECDFGIIPYPKYSEIQSDYYSRVEVIEIFATPVTAENLTRSSAIIEMMNMESMKRVIPAYYDVALRYKYTRDTESEEMLDVISKGRRIDLGDCVWWDNIRQPVFGQMFLNNDRNVVSMLEKHASAIEVLLTNVNESFR
ncbi:MAG: extracellular solute-binding protein [Oscillospiraceae bacterium]|nr:extracellular solute-binding protein [Oscillospiraceae bacterium]